jgi:two-component system sensor histidine kinase PilS (NtrC family)
MLAESQLISPCPFSKGYKIPVTQAWFLLKSFSLYRAALASLFIAMHYLQFDALIIKEQYLKLYLFSSFSYLLIVMLSWFCIYWQSTSYATQAQVQIFTDIFMLTLIMHACGGLGSGVGALMLVSTGAGGLLIGGRCAMLFAAIASLFVFAEQVYTYRIGELSSISYSYAGILGAGFFSLALLSYMLAKRSEQTELISTQQKETIISLEELNQYIIQNMQSGIIISNQHKIITSYNEACPRLLGISSLPEHLADISSELANAFDAWAVNNINNNFVNISISGQEGLNVHFASLPTRHDMYFMITLEDTALYNQRVQQSKLASLGLLTANIAHEIRNPLSAISHAGELLAECPDLSKQDLRLTEIIKTHACRVNSIIEDILQLSRRHHSRQQRIRLQTWLPAYLAAFEAESSGHINQFRLSLDKQVRDILVDPNHLTQILNNLCENALKYSYVMDKAIVLRLTTAYNQTCIEVIDFGENIPAADVEHLFEPFYTTSSLGTGLGLYISRELAELNQAKLSYHRLGNGNCFRLCLADAEQKRIEL